MDDNNVDVNVNLLDQIVWNERNAGNENFDNDIEDDEDQVGDGTLDGGVARGTDDTTDRKSSSECDLVRPCCYVETGRVATFGPNIFSNFFSSLAG